MSSDEQIFARSLVHPEKPIRDKTIKELQKYLRSLTEITDLDMLKLWKALFYCLWLTDQSHIQMELSQTLANLMDSLVPKKITSAASQSPSLLFDKYLRMFYQILFHEWHHLDQYRLNKFYTLIRLMIRKSFQILYQLNYPSGLTQDFLRILTTEVLDKHPNGPRYHLCDIYLPELFIATNGGDITTENFVTLIRPFFSGLGLATDSSFYSRISEKIFGDYHRIYAREHARDAHPLHPENGHSLIQHEVVDGHISTPSTEAIPCFKYVSSVKIQMILFDIASSDPTAEPLMCTEGHRRKIYSLHGEFQKLTKVQFGDEDSLRQDLDHIPTAPCDLKKQASSDSTAPGKEKKTKKKKAGKGGEEQTAVDIPIAESIPPVVEEPIKQLKKKSKKIVSSQTEPEPVAVMIAAPETPSPTISTPPPANYIASKSFAGAKPGYVFKKGSKGIGYYKDAFARAPKIIAASNTTPVNGGGGKPEKKRKIEEAQAVPEEQVKAKKTKSKEARVRFGKNQSKDYNASIQGLRSVETPIQTLQPTKSAVKRSDETRRKAASYF